MGVAEALVPGAAVDPRPTGGRDAAWLQPASTRISARDSAATAAATARAGRGRDALRGKLTSLRRNRHACRLHAPGGPWRLARHTRPGDRAEPAAAGGPPVR